MKKWILIGGGAVVVIIIIAVVVGLSNLGPIIKGAVNTYGPKMTKTDVRLGDVKISIFSAKAELKDFLLGNPRGFKSGEAMRVGSIEVDVDETSLTGDTIIIEKIAVIAPQITYEKIKGTDNFQTILNNVKKTAGADKPAKKTAAKEPAQEGGGKKILIKDFIVSGGKVNLSMSMLGGKTVSADLPDIHLENVGEGGKPPAEAFRDIFEALYGKITSGAVTDVLNQGLKSLGTNLDALGKGDIKQLETVGKDAVEKLKGGGDVQKQMESVSDSLKKGLFGK
jgi:uncharacterized protein involved in outer membrane biogenesis